MNQTSFNQGLLTFLDHSPTPFHAVKTMSDTLRAAGFEELRESDSWELKSSGRYFVTRNDSSIVAFTLADRDKVTEDGFRMVGAHTDSPCLKVKPNPESVAHSYLKLGVEVYGGALLNPWFDRDLSMAGRVSYRNSDNDICSCLVNFVNPVVTIPSLAIHLNREANKDKTVNPQTELPAILMQVSESKEKDGNSEHDQVKFTDVLTSQIKKQYPDVSVAQVLDYEIALYDTQRAAVVGLNSDFISSARMDNLLSCYIALQSILSADEKANTLIVCNDHEEVGSQSAVGAQGPFLESVLLRICGTHETMTRTLDASLMISADNAHGIHPNYADKHDANHGPLLNRGPVIKLNANQRYATNSETSAMFKHLAEQVSVPVQSFVVRTDMACGSTIGPITAGLLGVKTLDIGVPQFAMHSIREMIGSDDAYGLYQVLATFFDAKQSISIVSH